MVISETMVLIIACIFVFGPAVFGLLLLVPGILVARNEEKRQKHTVFVIMSFIIAALGVLWTIVWLFLSVSGVLDGRTRKEMKKDWEKRQEIRELDQEKKTALKKANADKKGVSYTYDDAEVIRALTIFKSVYDENELRIYMAGNINEEFKVSCYDKDFHMLEKGWKTNYQKGCYSIIGENVSDISGIMLTYGDNAYRIRYLDTDQFAILYETFVCDIGMELSEGDESLYYTAGEIAAKEAHILEEQKKYEETFQKFEGKWVSLDDEMVYIKIYEDDGVKTMEKSELNSLGKYEVHVYRIDDISVIEAFNGKELTITEGMSWGIQFQFGWNEEKQTLTEGYRDMIVYMRK